MLRSLFVKRCFSSALPLRQHSKPLAPLYRKSISPISSILIQPTLFTQQRTLHASLPSCHQVKSDGDELVADPKHQLLIGFTCKVCEVRSHHLMSKQAYTKGVVLIQCPDCKNRHLIADNLGWFQDSKTNVEDLVKEKGEAIRKVVVDDNGNRVPVEHLMEWLPQITAEEEERIQAANDKAQQLQQEKENKDV